MKIGILTYHRTLNYGGCLQALATRLMLEQMGHEVYYVDYWPDYHKRYYSFFNRVYFQQYSWYGKLYYLYKIGRSFRFVRKRQKNFEVFHKKYTYPFCRPLTDKYDVIIYGSDQIWRVQKPLKDYNPIYFGDNQIDAKLHVAFSASMGLIPESMEQRNRLKLLLSHLDYISVRESNLLQLVHELGYKDAIQTIDPTLLLDSKIWDTQFPTPNYSGPGYILVYNLWGRVFNMDSVTTLAKRKGLIVKELSGTASKGDTETLITTAGPDIFISLIKNATYIFTSSFHGLAFSLIYGKQVFASFESNGGRARSLLDTAGIPERYLDNFAVLPEVLPVIDYEIVKDRLMTIKKESINYLHNSIKQITV